MHKFPNKVPQRIQSNPGKGSAGSTAFTKARRRWTEHFDLVRLLESVLGKQALRTRKEESWLVLQESGFYLLPQIVVIQPMHVGGTRTTTTIQANHSVLVPDGVFEYQHSTGPNVEASLTDGLVQWARTDLVALLEASQPKPKICTSLEMEFPAKEGCPASVRRAILGPVTHVVQNAQAAGQETGGSGTEIAYDHPDDHEFCPCCLLTKSFEAFRELIESDSFYGLRLFAMRDENGNPRADCRVNGNDWEKGAEALRRYVATWPPAEFELRKQYVVLHSIDKNS